MYGLLGLVRTAREGSPWGTLVGVHNPFTDYPKLGQRPVAGSIAQRVSDPAASTAALQAAVDRAKPVLAIHNHALRQVLTEGRFKSQFETGTSKGALSPEARSRNEAYHFGYPHATSWQEGHPDHARPLYGYLAEDPVRNTSAVGYGDHVVEFKNHVRGRTTFMQGDTMGNENDASPSPLTRASLHSIPFKAAWTPELARNPRLMANPKTHDEYLRTFNVDRPTKAVKADYVEAQYHGGLDTSDIKHVYLRTQTPEEDLSDLKALLDAKGISWSHHLLRTGERVASWKNLALHRAGGYFRVMAEQHSGEVLAQSGPHRFLLDLGEREGEKVLAQVADVETGRLSKPVYVHDVIKHGYWHEPTPGVEPADILPLVRPQV